MNMDMDLRDWLAIIFIIGIILTLLDGFRRKWLEKRRSLKIKLDKNIPSEDESYDYEQNHELPNGGARVAEQEDPAYYGSPEDEEDLDESVPVLVDEVELEDEDELIAQDEDEDYYDDEFDEQLESLSTDDRIEPSFGEDIEEGSAFEEVLVAENRNETKPAPVSYTKEDQTELFIDHSDTENKVAPQAVQEVIIVNVMAKSDDTFAGKDLLPILMKHSMRLGDMSIFHCHSDSSGNGPIMFSMANMVKPGTFDISQMEEFTTPGISFFLQMPNSSGNMKCFEQMLSAANAVKEGLNGDLKDEDRNVITRQTLEHSRERIRDFELKQLSGK